MILSNVEVHRALDAKRLIIDPEPLPRAPGPGEPSPYGTHSVDLRLGAKLLLPQKGPYNFDLTQAKVPAFLELNSRAVTIEHDRPFILEPNVFALGMTLERVALPIDVAVNRETKTCLAARIEGKSSRARCGILVHFTAPTVHPGWDGALALEMINLGPVPFVLKLGMPIAQLIVEEVKGVPVDNPSQFHKQVTPAGTA
jgi:dCTP deaminase